MPVPAPASRPTEKDVKTAIRTAYGIYQAAMMIVNQLLVEIQRWTSKSILKPFEIGLACAKAARKFREAALYWDIVGQLKDNYNARQPKV